MTKTCDVSRNKNSRMFCYIRKLETESHFSLSFISRQTTFLSVRIAPRLLKQITLQDTGTVIQQLKFTMRQTYLESWTAVYAHTVKNAH